MTHDSDGHTAIVEFERPTGEVATIVRTAPSAAEDVLDDALGLVPATGKVRRVETVDGDPIGELDVGASRRGVRERLSPPTYWKR
ncbi:hypothetical protein [Natronobeatus ordinarius]|uniref:hypothetical protein n=1 Tax=Natronobeatus ordinarius TaxID=2963433 RepID=UPI0020CD0413|nr:hypothetical protein [Natronobeatus ordinarius]